MTRFAWVLLAATLLGACSSTDESLVDDARPAAQIFADGEARLAAGQPLEAAALFDDVERLYPYSELARDAMLRAAEAYYLGGAATDARLAAERFLGFYPNDPRAARAQFIIAQTWYDQIVDVGRDQSATREALDALRETVRRYPTSDYARRAQLQLDLTNDHLAGKEMEIGRFYLRRGHYTAAINRFRTVLEVYQTTSHVPEALHRLVEAYLALGLAGEAQSAGAVLGHNFPGSDWYASSYALLTERDLAPQDTGRGGWLSGIYRQVVRGEWL